MNLCLDGHEEVCYEKRECPICNLIQEMNDNHRAEIGELEEKISELQEELEEELNK